MIWEKQPSDHNEPLCRATTQGREVSQYSLFPWLHFCCHLNSVGPYAILTVFPTLGPSGGGDVSAGTERLLGNLGCWE